MVRKLGKVLCYMFLFASLDVNLAQSLVIGVRAGGSRGAAAPPVTKMFEIFRAKR